MAVRRIVANVATAQPGLAAAFYADILGLRLVMDQGWIMTFAADAMAAPQISFAAQGGSGAEVPELTVEVDDLTDMLQRAQAAGLAPSYGPVREPWGVTRFFLRDPFGRLVNVMEHTAPG